MKKGNGAGKNTQPPPQPGGSAGKLCGAIGLARRAGALAAGFDAAMDAAARGEAALVLVARDISPGSKKRFLTRCGEGCAIADIPLSIEDIANIIHKPAGLLAVTDKNLATLCLSALPKRTHEEEPD